METTNTEGKRRGPLPGPERSRTTVYLEPDLVEWAKRHPLGLSELVRRLLSEERKKEGTDERTAD